MRESSSGPRTGGFRPGGGRGGPKGQGARGGPRGGKAKRRKRVVKAMTKGRCRFTRAKVDRIDYKDTETLSKLLTAQGRIFSRKRSGSTAYWQRQTKLAIKRARFMGLLPYNA